MRKPSADRPIRALARLACRRRQFAYYTFLWGPLLGGAAIVPARMLPESAWNLQWGERAFQAVLVVWLILLVRVVFSQCPRCTDFFWQRMIGGGGGFSDRCVHCGLELYPPDDAQPKTAVDNME